MKQILGIVTLVIASIVLSGCSTIQNAEQFNDQAMVSEPNAISVAPIAHINARISGCYLFNFIPLWTGSGDEVGGFEMFSNNVNLKNAMGLIAKRSKELGGARIIDLKSEYTEKAAWKLLSQSWIAVKEFQVSGTCTK